MNSKRNLSVPLLLFRQLRFTIHNNREQKKKKKKKIKRWHIENNKTSVSFNFEMVDLDILIIREEYK